MIKDDWPVLFSINVKPIYGWGWSMRDNYTEVPEQFLLHIIEATEPPEPRDTYIGVVKQAGHVLSGKYVVLTARHSPRQQDFGYNVLVMEKAPSLASLSNDIENAIAAGFAGFNISDS